MLVVGVNGRDRSWFQCMGETREASDGERAANVESERKQIRKVAGSEQERGRKESRKENEKRAGKKENGKFE